MHLLRRMVIALVGGVQALVASTHHQRRHAQDGAPVGAGRRRQRPPAAVDLVEMVDDGGAVDQGLAIVEDQGRNAAQRIGGPHFDAVAEAGKVALLVGQAVGLERDGDPSRVGRAVHSDQKHRHSSRSSTPEIVTCRYRIAVVDHGWSIWRHSLPCRGHWRHSKEADVHRTGPIRGAAFRRPRRAAAPPAAVRCRGRGAPHLRPPLCRLRAPGAGVRDGRHPHAPRRAADRLVLLGARLAGAQRRLSRGRAGTVRRRRQRRSRRAGCEARDVDTIVTVSSTGIATPSLEARVADRMGFRADVERVPVFGLGCAGGVSGLSIASRLAQSRPGDRAAGGRRALHPGLSARQAEQGQHRRHGACSAMAPQPAYCAPARQASPPSR